jgi:hypothetical protein
MHQIRSLFQLLCAKLLDDVEKHPVGVGNPDLLIPKRHRDILKRVCGKP